MRHLFSLAAAWVLVAVVALIVFKFKSVATAKLDKLTQDIFGKATDQINSEFGN